MYNANKFDAVIINNFISKEDCDTFIDFAKKYQNWGDGGGDFWKSRVIHISDSNNDYIKNKCFEIRDRIRKVILENYSVSEIYEDTFQIVKWEDGYAQGAHADGSEPDGSDNGCSWRDFGVIIYLNDDFDGGKTFYKNYNIEVGPKSGTLVIHPADINHLHGVTKIVGNTRYTMPSFWTQDINFSRILK